jgi:hypothetical protein
MERPRERPPMPPPTIIKSKMKTSLQQKPLFCSVTGELLRDISRLGVGEKVADTKGSGELALVVYVTKKVPLEQLGEGEVLPKAVAIGNENEATKEVPVDVVELGELSFEGIA